MFPLASNTSFEDAATIPLAAMTAAIGLFVRMDLPEPHADGSANPAAKGKGVIVWGASSSVGAFAVQMAKKAGLYVIGIAGAGAELAKSLGCDVVLDYRASDLPAKLKAAISNSGVSITHAYDAHSAVSGKSTSYGVLAEALQPTGGQVTVVLGIPKKQAAQLPKNVVFSHTLVGTAHDMSTDGAFARRWFRQLARWMGEGKFKGNVVRVVPGGLAGVREGLKMMEEGKISGEKLVCGLRVWDLFWTEELTSYSLLRFRFVMQTGLRRLRGLRSCKRERRDRKLPGSVIGAQPFGRSPHGLFCCFQKPWIRKLVACSAKRAVRLSYIPTFQLISVPSNQNPLQLVDNTSIQPVLRL